MNVGFALEYGLGHATHAENLKCALGAGRIDVCPTYVDLPFHNTPVGPFAHLPGVRSNWTLRASLGAYLGLRRSAGRLQAALFHTQVTALLSTALLRRLPSVISLDATPLQYDALGALYGHVPNPDTRVEALKNRLHQRAFGVARRLVTWSEWAKKSLVADYGVPAAKVTVIPPGVDVGKWQRQEAVVCPRTRRVSLLFVGGDWERKGGPTLLAALDLLPPSIQSIVSLHIVTRSPAAEIEDRFTDKTRRNVWVHRHLAPNSGRLVALFKSADLFVFPTRADCLPLAVLEAMAAGLPVITTGVGALPEAVTNGETGRIVPPDDPGALAEAIATLADQPALRAQLGAAAREAACARFDAAINYTRLVRTVAAVP